MLLILLEYTLLRYDLKVLLKHWVDHSEVIVHVIQAIVLDREGLLHDVKDTHESEVQFVVHELHLILSLLIDFHHVDVDLECLSLDVHVDGLLRDVQFLNVIALDLEVDVKHLLFDGVECDGDL